MATPPIKKGKVYGSWEVRGRRKRGDGRWSYLCFCVQCGARKTYAATTLGTRPRHKCNPADIGRMMTGGKSGPGVVTSETVENRLLTFRHDSESIMAMLDSIEDDPNTAVEKESLVMLLEMVPYAEQTYRERPNQPNAYALNSLLGQIRELRKDIEESKAKEGMASELIEQAIRPRFQEIGRAVVDSHYGFVKRVQPHLAGPKFRRVDSEIESITKHLAKSIDEIFVSLREDILKKLKER